MFGFLKQKSSSALPGQQVVAMTGAGGMIGSFLLENLGKDYHFKSIDIRKPPQAREFIKANINDYNAVLKACRGADAILHLASPRFGRPWNEFHSTAIQGTYNVFEAAQRLGINKVIYASSFHLLGWEVKGDSDWVTSDMPIAPDSVYAATKAFGEALGYYYARQYGISVLCLRIGTFALQPPIKGPQDRILKTWCSPEDMARLIRACLDASDDLGFQIFYGVSNNKQRFWDISNAKDLLGYMPQDDIEALYPID